MRSGRVLSACVALGLALGAACTGGAAASDGRGFVSTGAALSEEVASAGRLVLPPPAAPADYQLGAAYPPARGVRIVERDRTARPAAGLYGICYLNGFQTQPQETAWWRLHHPDLLVHDRSGAEVTDPGWPGEVLLDTRTASRRSALAAVLGGWMRGCARAGYRAVEPDNLDSWTRSRGLLRRDDAVAMARLLTARAHALGLAVAQKNAADLAPVGRSIGFDFAVAEECQVYDECGAYTRAYGRRVIEVEYADQGRGVFDQACRARAGRVSLVFRDRDLVGPSARGYRYATC